MQQNSHCKSTKFVFKIPTKLIFDASAKLKFFKLMHVLTLFFWRNNAIIVALQSPLKTIMCPTTLPLACRQQHCLLKVPVSRNVCRASARVPLSEISAAWLKSWLCTKHQSRSPDFALFLFFLPTYIHTVFMIHWFKRILPKRIISEFLGWVSYIVICFMLWGTLLLWKIKSLL